jgi:hypothetical protein
MISLHNVRIHIGIMRDFDKLILLLSNRIFVVETRKGSCLVYKTTCGIPHNQKSSVTTLMPNRIYLFI